MSRDFFHSFARGDGEILVCAEYDFVAAEPDVGIMSDGAEITSVKCDGREIYDELSQDEKDELEEKAHEHARECAAEPSWED